MIDAMYHNPEPAPTWGIIDKQETRKIKCQNGSEAGLISCTPVPGEVKAKITEGMQNGGLSRQHIMACEPYSWDIIGQGVCAEFGPYGYWTWVFIAIICLLFCGFYLAERMVRR